MNRLSESMRWTVIFATIFFGLSLFFVHNIALAQTGGGGTFVVRPAKVELTIKPGGSETRDIEVGNSTAFPLLVTVTYEDIAPKTQGTSNDEAVSLLGSKGGEYPLRELLSTPSKKMTLLSGESTIIPITVRIPRDAVPSGHYGSVVFTFKPVMTGSGEGGPNIAVESRLATLFFVRVEGEVKEEGKLEKFGLFNDEKYISTTGQNSPLRFQVAFTNAGNVHLNPYGRIVVSPLIGGDAIAEIDPWVVLPDMTRMREINIHEKLTPGYYTATLEQNRGYDDIVDEESVSFWVLPTFMQGVVTLALFIAFVWFVRRSLALSKHFISST